MKIEHEEEGRGRGFSGQVVYPCHLRAVRDDNFGIALFSRLPLKSGQALWFGVFRLAARRAGCGAGAAGLLSLTGKPMSP
jgi:hypothetical protein